MRGEGCFSEGGVSEGLTWGLNHNQVATEDGRGSVPRGKDLRVKGFGEGQGWCAER